MSEGVDDKQFYLLPKIKKQQSATSRQKQTKIPSFFIEFGLMTDMKFIDQADIKRGRRKGEGGKKQQGWISEEWAVVYNSIMKDFYIQSLFYHYMYLGSQPMSGPSMLQLTGQLTIMTHPAHLPHLQHIPSYGPSYQQPIHPQQPAHYHPQHSPCQANDTSRHTEPKVAQHERHEKDVNEVAVGNMLDSISKVNCETLRAFRDIRSELLDRISAQNQASLSTVKSLEAIQRRLETKSQQLLEKQEKMNKEEGKKLRIKRQEMEKNMKEKMEELLKQEKVQAEEIRKEKLELLSQEMDRYLMSREEKMQRIEDKMQEIEQEIEKLEDRLQLKIKEEVNRIQTQTKEAEKRSQEQIRKIKSQLRDWEQENREMTEKAKGKGKQGTREEVKQIMEQPAKYVMRTPNAKCFTINQNTITRSSSDNQSCKMVLLDIVVGEGVFSFSTHIQNIKGGMWIGVADRVTQKERNWAQYEHSIKYCYDGNICFATGDGQYSYKDGGIKLKDGMELLCEVEREKYQVTFTVFEGGLSRSSRQVHSPILCQPHRQLVPCFQMYEIGESISWELQ